METFEYLIDSPLIEDGQFFKEFQEIDEFKKGLFSSKQGKKTIKIWQSEKDYLNEKGKLGWELVTVLRNSMSYDIREYYFKRKINV